MWFQMLYIVSTYSFAIGIASFRQSNVLHLTWDYSKCASTVQWTWYMKCLLIYPMQIQGLFIQKKCICYRSITVSFNCFVHLTHWQWESSYTSRNWTGLDFDRTHTTTRAAIKRRKKTDLMHSFNISGQLKSFTLFPKLHRSWNVRVVSNQAVREMTLGDLSCSYHGSVVMRDLADNMTKHCIDFSSLNNGFSTT